jgi:hypothetical protein
LRKYSGNVSGTKENKNSYRISVVIPPVKQVFGMVGGCWEDNIKTDTVLGPYKYK